MLNQSGTLHNLLVLFFISANAIPDNAVNEFMVALKSERIDYLKGTKNWVTAKNGWLKRVNKY